MVIVTPKELQAARKKFSNLYAKSTKHHFYMECRWDVVTWLRAYRKKH